MKTMQTHKMVRDLNLQFQDAPRYSPFMERVEHLLQEQLTEINSGSGNFSVDWNAAQNWCEITITGETYSLFNYTTLVTPTNEAVRSFATNKFVGKLLILLKDSSGVRTQGSFHFIAYKN